MAAAREPVVGQPAAASREVRPLSPVTVCTATVVAAIAWLGAVFANVAPLDALPAWLRGVARTPLVLTVPAIIIPTLFVLLTWSRHARPARNARGLYAVQALALVIVALPALLPFSPALLAHAPEPHFDLSGLALSVSTALRVPGLSLGVALAMTDPLVVLRARTTGQHGPSPRAVAGIALSAILLVTGFTLTVLVPLNCSPSGELGAQVCVIPGTSFPAGYPFEIAGFCAVSALLGVWLGYALGAALAQADRWT